MILTTALAIGLTLPARGEELKIAPDYSARVLGSHDETALGALRGKVVLLNTWATWCAPCRVEMPDFEAIHERYKDRGLVVVGVNVDEGDVDEKVERFVERLGVSFAIWRDPGNRFAKRFRVLGVPETLLVGRDGKILRRWSGPMDPGAEDNLGSIETALGQNVEAAPDADRKALVQRGRRLAEQRGCFTCHSIDGSNRAGPTWKNLRGSEVALEGGRRMMRDTTYLERAIRDPDAEVVAGYEKGLMSGAMPGKRLSDADIEALVIYIESL